MEAPYSQSNYHLQLLSEELIGFLKAISIVGAITALILVLIFKPPFATKPLVSSAPHLEAVASIPYTYMMYPELGSNPTPLATLPVKVGDNSVNVTFLIDTGALISTIPIRYAKDLNIVPENQKRLLLQSLTSQTVFGYMVNATVILNGQEITIPIALAPIDAPVLGRQGFLENYTLTFDHSQKAITVSKDR